MISTMFIYILMSLQCLMLISLLLVSTVVLYYVFRMLKSIDILPTLLESSKHKDEEMVGGQIAALSEEEQDYLGWQEEQKNLKVERG